MAASRGCDRGLRMPRGKRRRGLGLAIVEAMFTQAHEAVTGLGSPVPNAIVVGFALTLGAGNPALGLVAAIPVGAQLAQFAGAWLAPRLRSRRRLVAFATLASRGPWLLLGLAALALREAEPDLALGIFLAGWALANLLVAFSGNLWVSWMADLCPERVRGRFLSRHALGATCVGVIAPVAATAGLERGEAAFPWLFGVGSGLGVLAGTLLLAVPEPLRRPSIEPGSRSWREPFLEARFRRLLAILAVSGAATGLSDPFWASFQLEQLGFGYAFTGGAVVATRAAFMALSLSLWGRLADRAGSQRVVAAALGLLVLQPAYYLVARGEHVHWLLLAEAATTGIAWGGFNLAILKLVLELAPAGRREVYIAAWVTATGVAQAGAALAAGLVVDSLPADVLHPRQQVFLVTGLARIACFVALIRG